MHSGNMWTLGAGALVILIGALGSAPPHASASHGCTTLGKALVRTSEARIFVRRPARNPDDPIYYGCLYRKGSTYRLNFEDGYGTVVNESLPPQRA